MSDFILHSAPRFPCKPRFGELFGGFGRFFGKLRKRRFFRTIGGFGGGIRQAFFPGAERRLPGRGLLFKGCGRSAFFPAADGCAGRLGETDAPG